MAEEIDIYLVSIGSMDIHADNTMASFRNHLSQPLHLEGDWRVAVSEITFPHNVKNITTTDFFIYTDKTVKEDKVIRTKGGSKIIRQDWNDNAKIEAGQYKTIREVVNALEDMPVYQAAIIRSDIRDGGEWS